MLSTVSISSMPGSANSAAVAMARICWRNSSVHENFTTGTISGRQTSFSSRRYPLGPPCHGVCPCWRKASAGSECAETGKIRQHTKSHRLIHLPQRAANVLRELVVLEKGWPGTSSPLTRGPESVCHSVRLLFTSKASMFWKPDLISFPMSDSSAECSETVAANCPSWACMCCCACPAS